jgi:hypothetical protein
VSSRIRSRSSLSIAASSTEARSGITRITAVCVLLALGTSPGCVRRETLTIAPATMAATACRHNHADGSRYVLIEKATLGARVKFRSVHRWGLRIVALAAPGPDGAWPQLRVEMDGVPTRTIVVSDRKAIPYWLNFASEPGISELRLSLLNGGPYLVIEQVDLVPL